MEWIKINKDNLPKGEVLAANFEKGSIGYQEKLVGWLSVLSEGGILCESEGELENCTHYIDIDKFDI